ncbi:MAG: FAD-dependent monooxygenase, partial [Roseibium sp.]
AYEIGQRLCDAFDDVPDIERDHRAPRIFIAGDACHTHSPKAGQGMNVSMADAFNLGWKLAAVLRGQVAPALLHTYSQERQAKAKELIDFDRDMARLFSTKLKNADEVAQFQTYFKRHGRYTAGVETQYDLSIITGTTEHQALATGMKVGMRFHSAPVIRLSDAKPMQLGHVLKADGRWRIFAFAGEGDVGQAGSDIVKLCDFISNPSSQIGAFARWGDDIDSLIDVRAVFQMPHQDMKFESMPKLLRPTKGPYGLIDYEKVFCPDCKNGNDIFDQRGLDRRQGVLIVVRPDQYIAKVQQMIDHEELGLFFGGLITLD